MRFVFYIFISVIFLYTDKVSAQNDESERCATILNHIRTNNGPLIGDLLNAIQLDDVDRVRILMRNGPHLVNIIGQRSHWSPLEYAVGVAKIETIEALIEYGDVSDRTIQTIQEALYLAAEFNKADAIRLFVSKGADVDKIKIYTPLGIAAYHNNTAAAKVLIELGANVDKASTTGSYPTASDRVTPLMHAAENNNVELIESFIAAGANVNAVNQVSGWSVLMYAARSGNVEAIEALFILGDNLDIEVRDRKRGWTALIHAIKKVHYQAVVALLDIGANTETTDSQKDMTPLMHIVSKPPNTERLRMEMKRMYMTLIGRGANVYATTEFGQSVLSFARPEFTSHLTSLINEKLNGNDR